MADKNGAQTYPSTPPTPPPLLPVLDPLPCHCADSNSVCLCFCSGKYNQSISHWQIPIMCNFMDDKPIWNQNDPLNVCMQLPQWANYDFFYFIYSHGTQETDFFFLKWNWTKKWEKYMWVWKSNSVGKRKWLCHKKGFFWGRSFWHTYYFAAQSCPSLSNCSLNCFSAVNPMPFLVMLGTTKGK